MDKKSTTIGILLIGLAIALMFFNAKNTAETAQPAGSADGAQTQQRPATAATVPARAAKAQKAEQPPSAFSGEKKIFTLGNDKIELRISSFGGGLETVELKDFPRTKEDPSPVIFNEGDASVVPALTIAAAPGVIGGRPEPLPVVFSQEGEIQTDAEKKTVSLTLAGSDGAKIIRRTWTVSTDPEGSGGADPYLVRHRLSFEPLEGANAVPAGDLYISTGMLPPTNGDKANIFLNASWFNGDDYDKVRTDRFTASNGFLGLGAHGAERVFPVPAERDAPFRWVATTNQYFANILAFPQKDVRPLIKELLIYPQTIVPAEGADNRTELSVVAYARIALPALRALTLDADFYIGPKEYTRLADLRNETVIDAADEVVQFTNLFGFISIDWLCKILVWAMNGIHDLIPANAWSWGWAIVLMTVIVKGLMWPLTMAQQRSARRMQKFQKPLQAIREKYKDNPQKMQQETMKLYREHKINPLAGCFPVLIQIPIFFAMYCTFQTCAELRLQGFLWIPDLSMPDLIPGLENVRIPLIGAHIHILPILMCLTMLLNMKLTPMPSAQPGQKKMFYAMMIIFPVICYSMPSALTLYWTLQNIFTTVQTCIVRRSRDREDASSSSAGTPNASSGGNGKKQPAVDIIPPIKKKGRGKGRVPAAKA